MADLQTLVERDMDRAGTPSYTFDDLARRRDRRHRTQRLTMMVVALGIAALGIAGLVRAWDPAAPPTPASEDQGAVGEKIAYRYNGVIGVIDADGGEVRWLPTRRAGLALDPAWSPDGTRIAFSGAEFTVVEREGRDDLGIDDRGIYVINADGTDLVRLTPSRLPSSRRIFPEDTLPAWSPDGTRIAFLRTYPSGNEEIYTMNADGSGLRPLTDEAQEQISAERLAWSPDGSEVIVSTDLPNPSDDSTRWYGFDAIDVDSSQRRQVAGPILLPPDDPTIRTKAPILSPDGTRVAFVRGEELFVANADGSGPRRIGDRPGEWFPGALTWSPDGTRIAALGVVTVGPGPSDWGLFVIDAEGTWLVRLTEHQGFDPAWWSPPSSDDGS